MTYENNSNERPQDAGLMLVGYQFLPRLAMGIPRLTWLDAG
jgi:hypothetical protein